MKKPSPTFFVLLLTVLILVFAFIRYGETVLRALCKEPSPEEYLVREAKQRKDAVDFAMTFMYTKYKFGRQSIKAIDCSAFTQLALQRAGISVPRTAATQYIAGVSVDREAIKPADLVFFAKKSFTPYHVGIYLGNNKFVHATASGDRVRISLLSEPLWVKRYLGSRRYIGVERTY